MSGRHRLRELDLDFYKEEPRAEDEKEGEARARAESGEGGRRGGGGEKMGSHQA